MDVYKDSFINEDEFDFENVIPYFKSPVDRARSKYETLMDSLSDKIQYLPECKRIKYSKHMINIITHLSVLSRIIEKGVEHQKIDSSGTDLESD